MKSVKGILLLSGGRLKYGGGVVEKWEDKGSGEHGAGATRKRFLVTSKVKK